MMFGNNFEKSLLCAVNMLLQQQSNGNGKLDLDRAASDYFCSHGQHWRQ